VVALNKCCEKIETPDDSYSLSNKCASIFCKRTILVQLIVENVVTCFWDTMYKHVVKCNVVLSDDRRSILVTCLVLLYVLAETRTFMLVVR